APVNNYIFFRSDTVELHADSAVTYSWCYRGTSDVDTMVAFGTDTGRVNVSPHEVTTYYVHGIDRHNCFGIDSVTIKPEPLTKATPDTLICSGSSITLKVDIDPSRGSTIAWTESAFHAGTDATINAKEATKTSIRVTPLDSLTYYIYTIKTARKCEFTDTIRIEVEETTTPSFTISYDGHLRNDSAFIIECENTEHFFFPDTVHYGGDTSYYKWYFNGFEAGTGPLFSDLYSGMVNRSSIYAEMTSTKLCVTDRTVKSNTIFIDYTKMPEADVNINSNKGLEVCPFDSVVVFQAHAPSYDTGTFMWFVKRADSGANARFENVHVGDSLVSTFQTGDQVYCIYFAADTCIKGSPKQSNILTFKTFPLHRPKATITQIINEYPAWGDTICEYSPVTFVAAIEDAGSDYAFNWMLDGTVIGPDNALRITYDELQAYTDTAVDMHDIVAHLETKHTCAIPGNVVEAHDTIYVRPRKHFNVHIDQVGSLVCQSITEEPVRFTQVTSNLWRYSDGFAATYTSGSYWSNWENSGAVSQQVITGGNGIVKATAPSGNNNYQMFGLTSRKRVVDYTQIDYALYYAAGSLQVYENGTYKGSFGSYRSGDVGEV
ncbi:MAG: hypothetical protein K2I83_03485, partial [Bacteroidales bacterium]|nr:hypothetical protein [Bacteroidales bacterium]